MAQPCEPSTAVADPLWSGSALWRTPPRPRPLFGRDAAPAATADRATQNIERARPVPSGTGVHAECVAAQAHCVAELEVFARRSHLSARARGSQVESRPRESSRVEIRRPQNRRAQYVGFMFTQGARVTRGVSASRQGMVESSARHASSEGGRSAALTQFIGRGVAEAEAGTGQRPPAIQAAPRTGHTCPRSPQGNTGVCCGRCACVGECVRVALSPIASVPGDLFVIQDTRFIHGRMIARFLDPRGGKPRPESNIPQRDARWGLLGLKT